MNGQQLAALLEEWWRYAKTGQPQGPGKKRKLMKLLSRGQRNRFNAVLAANYPTRQDLIDKVGTFVRAFAEELRSI